METTRLFASFSKVEDAEDGMIRVYGIASSESKDHDGEVITRTAMKAALPDYLVFGNIREMHQSIAAGTAIEASVDDAGVTHLGALIVDPSTVKKVKTGVLKGFSLGGKVTKRNAKDKSIIEGIRLTEISVVDRPANPDALITLAKFDSAGRMKKVASAAETDEPLKKGLYDVGELCRLIQSLAYIQSGAVYEASTEQDGSLMPTRLKGCVQSLVDCLRDMVDEETRELLGGMMDVAAMKKAIDDGGLAKSADVRSIVTEVIDSLGLQKAAITPGEPIMDDKMKAEQAETIQKAVKAAVDEATAPLSTKLATLEKSVADLTTSNADLTDKLAKSEKRATDAEKLAQDLADAAVAKGIVKAVAKVDDGGTKPGEKIEKKEKPTDTNAELRASFARPMSPIRASR